MERIIPGCLVGLPTLSPIPVDTHPGQQALMISPGFSRASTAVKTFMHALLTLHDRVFQPCSLVVPSSTHFYRKIKKSGRGG